MTNSCWLPEATHLFNENWFCFLLLKNYGFLPFLKLGNDENSFSADTFFDRE
jgi:hypothetical protein